MAFLYFSYLSPGSFALEADSRWGGGGSRFGPGGGSQPPRKKSQRQIQVLNMDVQPPLVGGAPIPTFELLKIEEKTRQNFSVFGCSPGPPPPPKKNSRAPPPPVRLRSSASSVKAPCQWAWFSSSFLPLILSVVLAVTRISGCCSIFLVRNFPTLVSVLKIDRVHTGLIRFVSCGDDVTHDAEK